MGWMAPLRHLCAKLECSSTKADHQWNRLRRSGSIRPSGFFRACPGGSRVHGVDRDGRVILQRQLKRRQVLPFYRVREQLIGQRTQIINMLRGQMRNLALSGQKPVACQGVDHPLWRSGEPARGAAPGSLGLVPVLAAVDKQITAIEARLRAWHKTIARGRSLATIPGFGPILASAMTVRVPQPEGFASGRNLTAGIGPCSCQRQALGPRFRGDDGVIPAHLPSARIRNSKRDLRQFTQPGTSVQTHSDASLELILCCFPAKGTAPARP
jgi:Transposase IS116/IS110/IS902 family